jgi:neutral ceramidase
MKFILRLFLVVSGLFLLFLALAIGPIDRRPLESTQEGRATLDLLNRPQSPGLEAANLEAGWSRCSIVPGMELRLAGYGFRGQFEGVHDSLYVQVIALRNAGREVFIINADLMMFPAELARRVEREIRELYGDSAGCFFSASHTHTGYGNWEPSPAGQIILGRYRSDLVQWLSQRILETAVHARNRYQPVAIGFRKIHAAEWVRNRIDPEAASDGYLRILELKNSGDEQVLLASYAAHPVNIGDEFRVLSNDYPAALIRLLEATDPAVMAIFAAGMVGSHNPPPGNARDFERTGWIANGLAVKIAEAPPALLQRRIPGF